MPFHWKSYTTSAFLSRKKIKVDCNPCICWCCSVKYKGVSAPLLGLQRASGGTEGPGGTARWRGSRRPGQVLFSPPQPLQPGKLPLPKAGPTSLMSRFWQSIPEMNPLPLAKTKGVALSLQLVEPGTVNKTHISHHLSEGLRQALSPEVPQEQGSFSEALSRPVSFVTHTRSCLISLPFVSRECEVTPTRVK